jgi:hypothetical protein
MVYFRELQHYSKEDIAARLGTTQDDISQLIKHLKLYGVIRPVSENVRLSLQEDRLETTNDILSAIEDARTRYNFTFVGIVCKGDYVIKVLPKYISEDDTTAFDKLRQVLQVIHKYNSKTYTIPLATGDDQNALTNLLAIQLFLISDFMENGIYTNYKETLSLNNEGEIDWNHTVNELDPLIFNGAPFYMDFFSRNSDEDDGDFFRRLHVCIAADALQELKKQSLDALFSISAEIDSPEPIENLGDIPFLLRQVEKEMRVQFVTRKQMLLKTMFAYLSHKTMAHSNLPFSFYGTTYFHLIWEEVCKQVFPNVLNKPLSQLDVTLTGDYENRAGETLQNLITKPVWKMSYKGELCTIPASKTLIPDIIHIGRIDSGFVFCILDAKYYDIFNSAKLIKNQPGVADILKQYSYQMAYNSFISEHSFAAVKNAFVFPSDGSSFEVAGEVQIPFFEHVLTEPDIETIQVIKVPASHLFDCYLHGRVERIHSIFPDL